MRLLLLTQLYPFGRAEGFLGDELPFLAERFERIMLVPAFANARDPGPARALPEGVDLCLPRPDLCLEEAWRFRAACLRALPRVRGNLRQTLSTLLFFRRLLPTFRFLRRDLGPVNLAYSYWADPLALALLALPGVPRVARAHRGDLYAEERGLCVLPFLPDILRAVDRLAPCSAHGEAYLRERFPAEAGKIHAARLGVAKVPACPAPIRDAGAPLELLSCAFAKPVKRLSLILDALRLVRRPIRWTHIGDGPLLPELRAAAASLPSHVQTRFLGHLEPAGIQDLYRRERFDLMLNLSTTEGLPVSLMEALAWGTPIMATDVGGTAELLQAPFGVRLPAHPTAEDVARRLDAWQATPDMREAARGFQQTHFSTDNHRRWADDLFHLAHSSHAHSP